MLPQNNPDRIRIIFDDHRLVANAGLLLPATLAQHLGLAELVRQCLDLGNAPGRANTGDKIMTLVASALAGGDCIDDADALRTGGTACTLGSTVKAPSTLGTFLRSFRWGHVRQLDRVSRELLARAWAAGAGPGDAPFTIDLDPPSARPTGWPRRARHHGYTGTRGYHPLLAIAAGTGDVQMARLRESAGPTPPAAPPTSCARRWAEVRYAGARGQLTVRADSGFYTHGVVSVCRKMDVRFSITIRQHKSLRHLIEAIPETDWTPIPYWMDGAADVAETTYTPFESEAHARFPTGPLRQIQLSRLHHRPGRGDPGTGGRPSQPRRRRERHPRPQVRRRTEPSCPRAASPPMLRGWRYRCWPTTWPPRRRASLWQSRRQPPRPSGDASSPWPDASPARPATSPCICPKAGPGKTSSTAPWPDCAPCGGCCLRTSRIGAPDTSISGNGASDPTRRSIPFWSRS